jgi:hypothetical protein
MDRPNSSRQKRHARLNLERLEALCLPGETLLTALGAAYASDQMSVAADNYSSTTSQVSVTTIDATPQTPDQPQADPSQPPAPADASEEAGQQPVSTTTEQTGSDSPDQFGILTPTQIGALASTQTNTNTNAAQPPQDPAPSGPAGGAAAGPSAPPTQTPGAGESTPGGTGTPPPGGTLPPPDGGGTLPAHPGVFIQGHVWQDQNGNGVTETGEPDAAGLTVELLDANTGAVVASQSTNASGWYNILAPSGTYQIQFVAPHGQHFSPIGHDSSPDPITGLTAPFSVDDTVMLTSRHDAGLAMLHWIGPTFTWSQAPPPAPTVTSPGDQTNAVGDNVSVAVQATDDPADGALTYVAVNLPPGLTIDPASGQISGQVSASANGSYQVTVGVENALGGAGHTSFTWASSPQPPVVADPGSQTNAEGDVVSLPMQASSPSGATLTYAAQNLPAGLDIDPDSGEITGVATPSGSFAVTVTATDDAGGVGSRTFNWTVTAAAGSGSLELDTLDDQTNNVGDVVIVSTGASDPNSSGGSLTFSAAGLPDGVGIDPASGDITGTIANSAAGQTTVVTVTASDGQQSASQAFNWTIGPLSWAGALPDRSDVEGSQVSLNGAVTDPLGRSLSYTADGLPPGVTLDAVTGQFAGTITAGASLPGPYQVTETATAGGDSLTRQFTWIVTPTVAPAAPVLGNPGAQTNQPGDDVSLPLEATDATGYQVWFDDVSGLPPGLYVNYDTGTVFGTVDEGAVSGSPYTVIVTADDGVGETATESFTWAVQPSPLSVTVTPFPALEGNPSGQVSVATVTTPDAQSDETEFTASVNFGDGTTAAGRVDQNLDGSYSVLIDGHTYAAAGSYPLSVSVTKTTDGSSAAGSATESVSAGTLTWDTGLTQDVLVGQAPGAIGAFYDSNPQASASGFSVTIAPGGVGPAVAGQVSEVSPGLWEVVMPSGYSTHGAYTPQITVSGPGGSGTSGSATVDVADVFTGPNAKLVVTSFADDVTSQATDFTATIQWGDGSSSVGTITGSAGAFSIQGQHAYAGNAFAQDTASVVVTSLVTGEQISAQNGVDVAPPPLSLTMDDAAVGPDGLSVTDRALATFIDPNATEGAGSFSATARWADGTTSAATVSGGDGVFAVLASHSYQTAGKRPVEVDVYRGGGSPAALGQEFIQAKDKGVNSEANGNSSDAVTWTENLTIGNIKIPNKLFEKKYSLQLVKSWKVTQEKNKTTIQLAGQAYLVVSEDSETFQNIVDLAGAANATKLLNLLIGTKKAPWLKTEDTIKVSRSDSYDKPASKITRQEVQTLVNLTRHEDDYKDALETLTKWKADKKYTDYSRLPEDMARAYLRAYYKWVLAKELVDHVMAKE